MKRRSLTRQGVFAFSSLVLMAGGLAAVLKDFNPQWKSFQEQFNATTVKLAGEEIKRENARVEATYQKRLDELDHKIRLLTDATRSINQEELIRKKEAEIAVLLEKDYLLGQSISFAKSLLGMSRSRYEFTKNDPNVPADDVKRFGEEYHKYFDQVQKLAPDADKAYAALTKAKDELKELQKGPADVERERSKLTLEMTAWQTEVDRIDPQDVVKFTANVVRDLPLLDFIDPKFKLQQNVLVDYPDITGTPKVDRCITCHQGIADPKFDSPDVPVVFRAHPKLDLYLGKGSPHQIDKFACTTCHLGRGYGTTFTLAAHSPNSEEQAKEWKEKYGWAEMHYWDQPMLPKKNIEAMCYNCHKTTQDLRVAKDVFAGRQIYERRGCHGCHKIEGVSNDLKKPGPTLEKLATKLDPEWTRRWIKAPRSFYASAKMAHPFGHQVPSKETFPEYIEHLEHNGDIEHGHFDAAYETMKREDDVMIDAISAWLYENADKDYEGTLRPPPEAPGDPVKGETLVKEVNCLGCHKMTVMEAEGQGYAPDLSKVGSKTNRKWLFNWLRNPKQYWPDSNMPDPRLSDEEANDITAYLLTLKDEEYFKKMTVTPDDKLMAEIAVRYKRAKLSEAEATSQVAALNPHDLKMYVGEESMYRRGCFACHDVKGYKDRARIGAELTAEGFKEIELFDFGMHKYVHIPHTRHDWISKKVDQPYVYFQGKVMNPYEQSFYMPWFGFSPEENAKITTFILGQVGKLPPPAYRHEPRGDKEAILAGAKIIEQRNCAGCHQVGLGWQFKDQKSLAENEDVLWLKDALAAHFDPNLPEGKYAKISQVKASDLRKDAEGKVLDKVLVPAEGFISGEAALGEDVFGVNELLGPDPVEVNIGDNAEVKVALSRPREFAVFGSGEGYVRRRYEDKGQAPPSLRKEGAKVNPDWLFKFLKNVFPIRNHLQIRMPQWQWTDAEANAVVHYFAAAAGETYPYQTVEKRELGDVHREATRDLFGLPGTANFDKTLQCMKCHPSGGFVPSTPKEQWGPNLYLAQERLKLSFIKSWLKDPLQWQPNTRMPRFFYDMDGGKYVASRPNAEAEIGVLGEVIHYLPEIEEVKVAAAMAVEFAAPTPTPAAEAPTEEPATSTEPATAATPAPAAAPATDNKESDSFDN